MFGTFVIIRAPLDGNFIAGRSRSQVRPRIRDRALPFEELVNLDQPVSAPHEDDRQTAWCWVRCIVARGGFSSLFASFPLTMGMVKMHFPSLSRESQTEECKAAETALALLLSAEEEHAL